MKLIIPMAGRGTRLRPHTHVTPKPLLPVVGISMVERIVTTFAKVLPKPITQAVFVLGDFPEEVNQQLTEICQRHGIEARFALQEEAHGTGHAISCARDYLEGEIITVFADTLFLMEPGVTLDADIIAWIRHVDDPSRFGVVVRDESGKATGFVEKPQELISTEALIGIYFVKEGEKLREALDYMMTNKMSSPRGEYELTDAYDLMLKNGARLETATVTDWLDCGTIPALKDTTRFILERENGKEDATIVDSVVIEPCYIGPGAVVRRSVVGPYVSVEAGATVIESVIADSILFAQAQVENMVLADSVVGQFAQIRGTAAPVNIGDHSELG